MKKIENRDILDEPIKGEFIWYDRDKMVYYYQNGTQILGSITDHNIASGDKEIKYCWIRECRHKYYKDRHGENYKTLFTDPVKYWSDRLINSEQITI